MATVVISGNGEIGSAVASALYKAGHRVVLQQEPGRAGVLEGRKELDGVLAKRARRLNDVVRMVGCGRAIAVAVEPLQRVVNAVKPQLVLDARTLSATEPRQAAEAALRHIAAKGLEAHNEGQRRYGTWEPLGIGALIGYLGGLIGLGGAEFRLPALVGWFDLRLRAAIAANLVISMATVVSALAMRVALQDTTALAAYAWPAAMLALGSIAGAYVGASIASQVRRRTLHRVVGGLLACLAVLIALHGALPSSAPAALTGGAAMASGIVVGCLIGIVSSLLGVAGGELLIPTFVLLFGADIKLAGTLSLAVSTPTIAVALWRLQGTAAWREAVNQRRLLLWMSLGSILGALLGALSFGAVPVLALSVLLAAILAASAIKLYRG